MAHGNAMGAAMVLVLVGIQGLAMAITGFAIFDLTGNAAAAYAAAALPVVFALTGLAPNGAWALPALALAWAVGARVMPPAPAAPPPPVAAAVAPATG